MNARLSRIVSRLSIVSVLALGAGGLAACNRASTTSTSAQATAAQAAPARGPGHRMFREIESLDLREPQREVISEIEQNLAADLAPHRETIRQVAETLASAIEEGRVDAEASAAQRAALTAAAAEARVSFAGAMNEVHDALDVDQRALLVKKLREKHERGHAPKDEAQRQAGLAKLATELALTDEQKQSIHDGIRDAVESAFPDRKERREAWEAKMKALGEAFISDDFDAEDFDLGGGAEEAIATFTQAAERAVEIGNSVLGASQRAAVAELIRARAQKI